MYSMQQAMINGASLEYTVQGSHGEPVILIHGRMFADMYVPLMSQSVLANSYRLVNYYRRGYRVEKLRQINE